MTDEYDALVSEAADYHNERQQVLLSDYGIGTHERYDIDLTIGRITFSHAGRVCLVGRCWPAGSLSHITDTWLWAWGNLQYPPAMRGLSKRARRLGRAKGFQELAERKWPADEDAAWRVTSILGLLVRADGDYRCPGDRVDQFLVLRDLTWAS
jgi:hypothetical protein